MTNVSNLHGVLMSEAEKIKQRTIEETLGLVREDGLSVDAAMDRVMDEIEPCELLAIVHAYGDNNDIWNAYAETVQGVFEGDVAEELHAMTGKDVG